MIKRVKTNSRLLGCIMAGTLVMGCQRGNRTGLQAPAEPEQQEASTESATPGKGGVLSSSKKNLAPTQPIVIQPMPELKKNLKNATRRAPGVSGEEVFKLHWELRHRTDIHSAPSKREMEIWRILTSTSAMTAGQLKKNQEDCAKGKHMTTWGMGGSCMNRARDLYFFGDKDILNAAIIEADELLRRLNDPKTGVVFPGEGTTPAPVYVKTGGDRDEKPYYAWLSNGVLFRGPVTLANWILENPELRKQHPPANLPGVEKETYGQKAKRYLMTAKAACDHFLKYRKFDEKLGFWLVMRQAKGKDPGGYRPLPLNRGMIFNQALITTARGLMKLEPVAYGEWDRRAEHICRRSFEFVREVNLLRHRPDSKFPKENEYGPLYVWPYHHLSDNSEDGAHFGMDLGAMLAIARWVPGVFSAHDWKGVANTAFSGLYNYETYAVNRGLFRHPCKPYAPQFRIYGPTYLELIGKYMPQEAYEKAMNELLMLWDRDLKNQELRRIDTYDMPLEILRGRLHRYGKGRWLNLP